MIAVKHVIVIQCHSQHMHIWCGTGDASYVRRTDTMQVLFNVINMKENVCMALTCKASVWQAGAVVSMLLSVQNPGKPPSLPL